MAAGGEFFIKSMHQAKLLVYDVLIHPKNVEFAEMLNSRWL